MPLDMKMERVILLLCDSWSSIKEGIAGVNRSLALTLSRYKGIKVYCTIFDSVDSLTPADMAEAQKHHVTLLCPAVKGATASHLYTTFNEDPTQVFPSLQQHVPHVSQIVGHSPITSEGALRLREALYPDSKVVLFYHVIPGDVDWICESLPYVMPTDTELVQMAERADVVYSVTNKLHWYYTAKFRNRAQTAVDHRIFFPQSANEVFSVPRHEPQPTSSPKILILSSTGNIDEWQGLDIGACAVHKIATASVTGSEMRPVPQFIVGGIAKELLTEAKETIQKATQQSGIQIDVHCYDSPKDMYKDFAECDLCIVPSRAEPFGYLGLDAFSAGIPTLIAENSGLSTIINRLTSEPEYFQVPVVASVGAFRQDGSLWRDRILSMLQDPETAHERAMQLRTALRRDEPTKESHDNFISFCLGGICLKHEATSLSFTYRKDEEKELPIMRSFNKFLLAAMKQCWRLKHHPLTSDNDLYQILPGVDLPIKQLMANVTDKIEEYDRRIVGVDEESGSFVVYCPTPDALSDLWAMCDRINGVLIQTLLSSTDTEDNQVLKRFTLKSANVRTHISGPNFLKYKNDLMKDVNN